MFFFLSLAHFRLASPEEVGDFLPEGELSAPHPGLLPVPGHVRGALAVAHNPFRIHRHEPGTLMIKHERLVKWKSGFSFECLIPDASISIYPHFSDRQNFCEMFGQILSQSFLHMVESYRSLCTPCLAQSTNSLSSSCDRK